MSDLHQVLNDPSKQSESTLSYLFSAGDAGLTFQRNIFQYLNIHDAKNLRMANSRLDEIVSGETMWEMYDRNGNPFYERKPPANPTAFPIQNSTLLWLGARCNGQTFPGPTPCPTNPMTDIKVKRCTDVPTPLNRNRPLRLPCRGDVCRFCITNAANNLFAMEIQVLRQAHETRLCKRCQLYEARRNPYRKSDCNCQSLLRGDWRCWPCRHETRQQIGRRTVARKRLTRQLHRVQGRKILDSKRLERNE